MAIPQNHIALFFLKLVGKPLKYSLEARVFHVVVLIAVLTATINMTINFYIGLTFYGLIVIPLIGILIYGYYLSRYQNRLAWAVNIFAFIFNLMCGMTYFASEGSSSVNLFTFILIIFILSFICSKKQALVWVPLTILHVMLLFVAEWLNPELAKPLYQNKSDRLIDVAQTWIEVSVMIAVITMMIQKAYQRQKEHAQNNLIRLEQANEAKTRLFSIISHDLRAPLQNIEQYLNMIGDTQFEAEEKQTIEQQLLNSTRQTSEMLQNILIWSKQQMSGTVARLSSIDLDECLKSTIAFAQILASEKQIELNYRFTAGDRVIADTDMLQLVVRNLLHNAIKFSFPKGEIQISAYLQDSNCIIQIRDNGIGIKGSAQEVFSKGYQRSYGTNHEIGVGLGLMLAKDYMLMQNGKIWFDSVVGEGTVFYISLPKG